jgi:hypothetical protein
MPIMKSSANGEPITVVVFNSEEMDALVSILRAHRFGKDNATRKQLQVLEEFFYGIDVEPTYK